MVYREIRDVHHETVGPATFLKARQDMRESEPVRPKIAADSQNEKPMKMKALGRQGEDQKEVIWWKPKITNMTTSMPLRRIQ